MGNTSRLRFYSCVPVILKSQAIYTSLSTKGAPTQIPFGSSTLSCAQSAVNTLHVFGLCLRYWKRNQWRQGTSRYFSTTDLTRIRREAVDVSIMIASKLIRRNLSPDDNQALIDDALKQIQPPAQG